MEIPREYQDRVDQYVDKVLELRDFGILTNVAVVYAGDHKLDSAIQLDKQVWALDLTGTEEEERWHKYTIVRLVGIIIKEGKKKSIDAVLAYTYPVYR